MFGRRGSQAGAAQASQPWRVGLAILAANDCMMSRARYAAGGGDEGEERHGV